MRRFALFAIVLVVGCAPNRELAIDTSDLRGPITLELKNIGHFDRGSSWTLELDATGNANLNILGYPSIVSRTFQVSDDQIERLRALLIEQRFFQLGDEYGEHVLDSSTRTLTIACGDHSHTLQLHFLMNWVHGDTTRLRDPGRAVRVWRYIRTWFDDKEAVDLKRYDDMVLDVAPL